jgi:glyoxylase I family protein
MLFKRIDHIELLTAAPERAVAFYTGVLGFRERERTRIPQTPQGPLDLVYLQLGDTTLEVMCFPEGKSRIPERGAQKAEGVEPAWGPMKRPDYARAEIRDPDGNPIELRQWYPAGRQPAPSD